MTYFADVMYRQTTYFVDVMIRQMTSFVDVMYRQVTYFVDVMYRWCTSRAELWLQSSSGTYDQSDIFSVLSFMVYMINIQVCLYFLRWSCGRLASHVWVHPNSIHHSLVFVGCLHWSKDHGKQTTHQAEVHFNCLQLYMCSH